MPMSMCGRCKRLYSLGSRCEPCAKARARMREKARVRPSPAERGYNAEYRRNRRIVLAGNPLCSLCNLRPAGTADHIVPLSRGGTNNLSNLRPACGPCNYSRGNRTA
ncbi:HNH endonuclease [Streptomyces sp. NPDC001380]|uniref:HNH endonuclease n=1 Tax=Streptomyces sp. NPDC001380 TaxID=3364566 RepID=UPI0036C0871E